MVLLKILYKEYVPGCKVNSSTIVCVSVITFNKNCLKIYVNTINMIALIIKYN